jgi:hypothetical protein
VDFIAGDDCAGWHMTGKLAVPKNISPILLPSRGSHRHWLRPLASRLKLQ